METTLDQQDVIGHTPQNAAESEPEEMSPEKAEERYLELLRMKAKEIKETVYKDHQIKDLETASREEREEVVLDLKRRILDLLQSEHDALLEASESGEGEAYRRFINESEEWYRHLDKQERLEMFQALGKQASYSGQIEMAVKPTAEIQVETPDQRKARLLKQTKTGFRDSLGFLAEAVGGGKAAESAGVLVEVKPGDSLWSILEDGLSK